MKHAFIFVIAAVLSACGSAQSITAGVACNTLIVAIGEAHQLDAERAVADIHTVSAVCRRLEVTPDAGVDGSTP